MSWCDKTSTRGNDEGGNDQGDGAFVRLVRQVVDAAGIPARARPDIISSCGNYGTFTCGRRMACAASSRESPM